MRTTSVREQMVEQQVRAWDVLDKRVLDALRELPRELFVPEGQRFRAYADAEVPLAHGQHMLRPSVAGRILQALLPQPGEAALEIGTGSGFLTAALRGLAGHVTSLEIFPALAAAARANLAAQGATLNAITSVALSRFQLLFGLAAGSMLDRRWDEVLEHLQAVEAETAKVAKVVGR